MISIKGSCSDHLRITLALDNVSMSNIHLNQLISVQSIKQLVGLLQIFGEIDVIQQIIDYTVNFQKLQKKHWSKT